MTKITVPYEGDEVLECNIVPVDKFDLPASAKEMTSDELGEKVATDMMAIIFGSMDLSALEEN